MKPDHSLREEALADLLRSHEGPDLLSEDEAQAITAAFDALDEAPEIILSTERRDALREMMALDFASEVAEPTFVEAARGVEELARSPLKSSDQSRLLDAILKRVSAFTSGDDWAWIAATVGSFIAMVALTGVRETPASAESAPSVLLPTLFLLAAGSLGMRLTRKWGDGALYGALMAGVAAMTLGAITAGGADAFLASESVTGWIGTGIPCLGLGTATALFAALPFVLMRQGVSVGDGARLGAMGAITGAAVLHAHCPIPMLDHIVWHALAIGLAAAIGAMLVLGKRSVLAILSA